jgi:hypothetical protein
LIAGLLIVMAAALTAMLLNRGGRTPEDLAATVRASVFEAAHDAASLRFRAVMMTALSFVLGILPLVSATGVGAASRRALGSAILGGMLAAISDRRHPGAGALPDIATRTRTLEGCGAGAAGQFAIFEKIAEILLDLIVGQGVGRLHVMFG